MRHHDLPFAGWPGGARAVAPEVFAKRDAQVERQFDFLLRYFTPRTVFMDIGSRDCELALRAAGYVERVWCVEAPTGIARSVRPPCNLRMLHSGGLQAIAPGSIDVAFSEAPADLESVHRALVPGGVYVFHAPLAAGLRRRMAHAGFSRVNSLALLLARWRGAIRVVARK